MIGNYTYLQSSGVSSNVALRMRVHSNTFSIKNNISTNSIPGANTRPNSECDKVGTNNAQWNIQGIVPMRSGINFPEGLGAISNHLYVNEIQEISISGLMTLALTGSKIWFYDEALTIKSRVVSDALVITSSGTWVEIDTLKIGRSDNYVDSGHEVGYVLPYTLVLTETKGDGE